LLAARLVATSY